jgi:hypothetical protein
VICIEGGLPDLAVEDDPPAVVDSSVVPLKKGA